MGTDIPRHASFGIVSALVTLAARSLMLFNLIGEGTAVKGA